MATSEPTKSMLIGLLEEPPEDVTVRLTVAVSDPRVPVPVMVSGNVPVGVLVAVVTVSVELFPALTEVGLNVPVAPVGSPVTPRLIVSVKPPRAVVFTV
jgi:hypothetical protein